MTAGSYGTSRRRSFSQSLPLLQVRRCQCSWRTMPGKMDLTCVEEEAPRRLCSAPPSRLSSPTSRAETSWECWSATVASAPLVSNIVHPAPCFGYPRSDRTSCSSPCSQKSAYHLEARTPTSSSITPPLGCTSGSSRSSSRPAPACCSGGCVFGGCCAQSRPALLSSGLFSSIGASDYHRCPRGPGGCHRGWGS